MAVALVVDSQNQIVLHRLSTGPAADSTSGPSLLFAHAAGFSGRIWTAVSELVRPGWRSVALDFRGHGQSAPLPPDAGWDAFADDVRNAVRAINGPTVGVGHSLGATALLLAEAAAPGRFAALVCFEPVLATVDDPRFAAVAARRPVHFASAAAAEEYLSTTPPWSGLAGAVRADYARHAFAADPGGGVRLCCTGDVEAQIYRTAITCRWRDALPRIGCEVVMLRGSDSAVITEEAVQAAARLVRRCRVRTVPAMDHLGPLREPGRFAAVLNTEIGMWERQLHRRRTVT